MTTYRIAYLLLFAAACDFSDDGGNLPGGDGSPGGTDAAGQGDAAPPTTDGGGGEGGLGTVTVIDEACPDGDGPLVDTSCQLVEVSCPGIPPLRAQVRTTAPAASSDPRGTVLFGTGGGGESWYDRSPTAAAMLRALAGDGFRVVQRAWIEQWESGGAGLAAASCRYATLLTWVHDDVHLEGAFCASGNSGGSAEIAYALSRWGREEILDLAVPTGGPVMSRVDLGCLDFDEWPDDCQALVPDDSLCEPEAVQCNYQGSNFTHIDGPYLPDTPCEDHDAAFADTFLADSTLSPDADLDFGATRVQQIFGVRDCSAALPQGMLWHDAITSEHAIAFVPATGHGTPGTEQGAAAIRRAIDEECVPRR